MKAETIECRLRVLSPRHVLCHLFSRF